MGPVGARNEINPIRNVIITILNIFMIRVCYLKMILFVNLFKLLLI